MKLSHARAAGGAAAVLAVVATALSPAASAGTTNLIPNSGFESGTNGWVVTSAWGARLSQVTGGHSGNYAAAVSARVKSSPILSDGSTSFVPSTVRKATYSASVWVRSDHPRTVVALRLLERSKGKVVTAHQAKRTLHTTGWTRFRISLTARASGDVLDYQVIGVKMRGGTSFLVDDATLTSTATPPSGSTPTRTPTPTTTPTATPTSAPTSAAGPTSAPPTSTPTSAAGPTSEPTSTPTSTPSTSAASTPTSTPTTTAAATSGPPPSGGYFPLVPAGHFSSLPSDAQAAAMVHRSSWEPRPQNNAANHTVPPAGFVTLGYSGMQNHNALFGRVTGNFTGTTDEIIQWAAAKWGLPDEVIRAEAVDESNWYQNLKDSSGNPIKGDGYGDFNSCGGQGSPPPSGYGTAGPSSFGLLQTKWCTLKDASASGYGGWPWTENSTAYELDLYASVIRGCYEGWDTWLGGSYHSGDLWGCLGRWYSGQWYSSAAQSYISRVQDFYSSKPWLTWKG